ncbi:TPA: hypothetical protein ACGO91_001914 [Streptococcus suis]
MKYSNLDKLALVGIVLMMLAGLVYLFVKPVYSFPYIAISILLLITFNHQKRKK